MKTIIIDDKNIKNELAALRYKSEEKFSDIEKNVAEIINNVKELGDAALRDYTLKFDKAKIDNFKVTDEEINSALSNVSIDIIEILRKAAENIRQFHILQLPKNISLKKDGLELNQIFTPIERVGVYVPGGNTVYPSTVLMNVIPAKIAGVSNISIATPPAHDGKVNDLILAAAHISGADTIYKAGGVQAIAALAYGTESIEKVYKITGPGNAYVAEAKKQVFGQVDIDMIAGPSEILIIADEDANTEYIAADLLSQAEHDVQAASILVCLSENTANKVQNEISKQLNNTPNGIRAKTALDNNGIIFIVEDLNKAFEISNEIAPEHLELLITSPCDYLDKVKNAGSIFVGQYSPEPVGDYFVGVNHTIPTCGKAKFASPLGTMDFIKHSNIIHYSKTGFLKDQADIKTFAEAENFYFHANSIARRK
ncbi:MAG: histidinol dehydrogenase [Eubacteriaceae bacterium]|nr:histidinol dehydrogenase [Eubacteriaceae bacterium]